MCKTLQVSASGFYAWLNRLPSARAQANVALTAQIKEIHTMSDATYGVPRVQAELADRGLAVNHKRIARLMRLAQLRGVCRRRSFCVTTTANKRQRPAPDWVNRKFVAHDINELWVADMTYIPTWEGFLYLAVVTDVFSRKVVGWAFGVHMTQELVIAALDMAVLTRKPKAVIHHSDQGSQYTSIAFGQRCKDAGVELSMGSVGDAYDNAMAESFFATLECELIARRTWPTKAQARLEIFEWIEGWYNPRRRHSGLGQMSPMHFEKQHEERNNPNQAKEKSTEQLERQAPEHGLTTGCFALVDKPPHCPEGGKSACPQASPMDNPALVSC